MAAEITIDRNGLPDLGDLPGFVGSLAGGGEPGLAVGVYSDGELVRSATAGCAVAEHNVKITERTAFDIASVSKHMTAACLLLLAGDGLVDLDADIRTRLPELALTSPVTLRQCLTHTAGLRDYPALCELAGIPMLGIGEDRCMELIAGQRELDFAAGSAFSYSNTGYVLAAALVRRVTGSGLAGIAAERLFGPLGMTATHFRDDVSLLVPRLAAGYLATGGAAGPRFRRCDVTETVVGDGAVVTSLADLAAWHGFMAGGAVLGTDLRDCLLAGQVLTDGSPAGYALGLASIEVGGEAAWWHSGSWAGYRSAVIYLPARRAGVSVLANRNDRYASHVAFAVASALVTGTEVLSCYAAAAAGTPAPAERARREAGEVAGVWHAPDLDLFIVLEAGNDRLTLRGQDAEHAFALAADGRWNGIGVAAGSTYAALGGGLVATWGLSPGLGDRYVRAEPGPPGDSSSSGSGFFRNEELRVHASIEAGESGATQITIGLAAPRRLVPAGAGAWRADSGGALTARLAGDGSALLISVPGAHHVRFERSVGAPAELAVPRGVRGAR